MRPRLLDLFCGAGGAAIGYQRAGFDVVGVDIRPQPNYPGRFVQADAMEVLRDIDLAHSGLAFDAIHASPPCQGYSPHVSSASSKHAGTRGKDEPQLIPEVRRLLNLTGLPFVIENVMGARGYMEWPARVCGTGLELPIHRHRLFSSNIGPLAGTWCYANFSSRQWALERGWDPRDMTVTGKGRRAGTKERWAEIMGWPDDVPVTQHGLREAIPPVYTEWIGRQLLAQVGL